MPSRDPTKILNERIKLLAVSCNAIGLGYIIAAAIRDLEPGYLYLPVGLLLHGVSHYILGFMEREG